MTKYTYNSVHKHFLHVHTLEHWQRCPGHRSSLHSNSTAKAAQYKCHIPGATNYLYLVLPRKQSSLESAPAVRQIWLDKVHEYNCLIIIHIVIDNV